MSEAFRLTIKELRKAADWAEWHIAGVHNGYFPDGDLTFRTFGNSGIGTNVLIMCEACERVPGKAGHRDNYLEVTDYDSW